MKLSSGVAGCNWLVTYRNRTYDLYPLTRSNLSRPLKRGIRSILHSVPKARGHMERAERSIQEAKEYGRWASLGLLSLAGMQLAYASSDYLQEELKVVVYPLSIVSGLVFLRSAILGWRRNQETKEELALAVQTFNAESREPILPYKGDP